MDLHDNSEPLQSHSVVPRRERGKAKAILDSMHVEERHRWEEYGDIGLLVLLARAGDSEGFKMLSEIPELCNFMRGRANSWYIDGYETRDLLQLMRFWLWKATLDFDPKGGESFPVFARCCMNNKLISELNGSRRKKRFNGCRHVSLEALLNDDESDWEKVIVTTMSGDAKDVSYEILASKADELLSDTHLSPIERETVIRRALGYENDEIGRELGINAKATDNARTRVIKKTLSAAQSNPWLAEFIPRAILSRQMATSA